MPGVHSWTTQKRYNDFYALKDRLVGDRAIKTVLKKGACNKEEKRRR
eukprot:SAG11_NODE_7715_length_1105_cov_1.996024_1_plen_46_part_10